MGAATSSRRRTALPVLQHHLQMIRDIKAKM